MPCNLLQIVTRVLVWFCESLGSFFWPWVYAVLPEKCNLVASFYSFTVMLVCSCSQHFMYCSHFILNVKKN